MTAIIFEHAGHTGGISWINAMLPSFLPRETMHFGEGGDTSWEEFQALGDTERDGLKFLYGHHIQKADTLLRQPFVRTTMIRHPVTMFISHYYWVSDQPSSSFFEPDKAKTDANFPRFLDSMEGKQEANRFADYIMYWRSRSASSEEDFRRQVDELLKGYDFIAICELFEESQILAAMRYPWLKISPWERKRVNNKAWSESDIDPALIPRIERIVDVDLQIYRRLRARMEADFAPVMDDDVYLGYKASCIASDRRLLQAYCAGDRRYLPSLSVPQLKRLRDMVDRKHLDCFDALGTAQEKIRELSIINNSLSGISANQAIRIAALEDELAALKRVNASPV